MGKISGKKYLNLENRTKICLLANRARALFYLQSTPNKFYLIKDLFHSKSKLTEQELVSDRPGRSFLSTMGSYIRHGLSAKENHHDLEAQRFAKEIGEMLSVLQKEEDCHEIILAAEPKFLGFLRHEFSDAIKKLITVELKEEFYIENSRQPPLEFLQAIKIAGR